jgi:hypothetical protein
MQVLGGFETRRSRHRQGVQALKVLGPRMARAEADMALYRQRGDAPWCWKVTLVSDHSACEVYNVCKKAMVTMKGPREGKVGMAH